MSFLGLIFLGSKLTFMDIIWVIRNYFVFRLYSPYCCYYLYYFITAIKIGKCHFDFLGDWPIEIIDYNLRVYRIRNLSIGKYIR